MTTTTIIIVAAVAAGAVAFVISALRQLHVDHLGVAAAEQAVRRSIWRHPRVRRFLRERLDRQSAGGLMLTLAFAIVLAMALGLGLLLDLVDRNETVASIDASISKWGSRNASSDAVTALKAITELGSSWLVVSMLTVVSVADFVRRRNTSVFAFVAIVGLGELALNNILKLVVARDRPSVLRLVGASGLSFPSGHSASAAAAWSAAALVLSRDRRRFIRGMLATSAVVIAVAVAASRALLGVHWVTDVIGGLLLGWGWFFLVAIVFGGRRQRLGDPVAPGPVEAVDDGASIAGEAPATRAPSVQDSFR